MIPAPQINLWVLAPIGFVAIGAMLVLLLEVFLSRARTVFGRPATEAYVGSVLAFVAMAFLGLSVYAAGSLFAAGANEVFNPGHVLMRVDPFSSLLTAVVGFAALLSCGLAISYLAELRINHGEFYALVLLATAGMMLMIAAVDFLAVFLGLELMSIPIYVLAGFDRRKLRSNESALKYFMIGSFASAILLYGIALLYGATGATSFDGIRAAFDPDNPLAIVGVGLIVVGFAFKTSAVPFHQWTPDVYEGAPSVVTTFMSVTVKTAAFAAFLRIMALALPAYDASLEPVLFGLAALTIIVGNVMAVIQDNVKRLLAYSSIAHAGYVLIGFVAGAPEGYTAVLFYLVAYTFMNLGAFGIVVALANRGQDCERVASFAGLARTRPGLAALMTLFLVSLAGIPGTVGFIAKFTVFSAAVRADMIWLPIIGVIMSVVSVYYYLRIPVLMYMHEPLEEAPRMETSSGEAMVLAVCAFAVLYLGFFPNGGTLPIVGEIPLYVIDWARESIQALLPS